MAIFTGGEATCNDLLEKLRAGALHFNDFRTVQKAIVSHYATKDGGQLVAFTDENDKVYLGKRDLTDQEEQDIERMGGELAARCENS